MKPAAEEALAFLKGRDLYSEEPSAGPDGEPDEPYGEADVRALTRLLTSRDLAAREEERERVQKIADRVFRDMDAAILRAKDAVNAGDLKAVDEAIGDAWIAQNALTYRDAARKRPPSTLRSLPGERA